MASSGFLVPQKSLQRIHDTAVRILAEVGIKTDHAALRDLLLGQGCCLNDGRLCIPADVVAATVQNIPSVFSVYGRSTADSILIGQDDRTYFSNTGIMSNIYDLESGEVRQSTIDDVRASTRLLDAMEYVDAVYVSLVDATDMLPHMVTVSDFAAVLANTVKPLIGPGVTNRAEARAVVAMARVMRDGDNERLRRFPICVPFICPISPLTFPKDIAEALLVISEAGLPLDVVSNPVMGMTSPYTIASTVAMGHAEVLAAAVMAQAVSPGLPVLNQNTPSVADMHSMVSTTGGPETGLIRTTVAQLSHYLGIPAFVHGHTSSTALDFQAADEKVRNALLIASGRPAVLGGLGGMANVTLTSYESILLDNEIYGAISRCQAGIQVDEDHLAFDVIAEPAGSGNFMTSAHTVKHLRSGEVWRPKLAARQGLVGGVPASATSVDRARAAAKSLLATHEVDPLTDDIQAEIDSILIAYDESHR